MIGMESRVFRMEVARMNMNRSIPLFLKRLFTIKCMVQDVYL